MKEIGIYFCGFGTLCLFWDIVFLITYFIEESFSLKFILIWTIYSIVLITTGLVMSGVVG